MAITTTPFFTPESLGDDISTNIQNVAIGGKLLTVTLEVSQFDAILHINEEAWRNIIKQTLAVKMATAMIQNNMCEFTTIEDPSSLNRKFNIRCYLAPDDQVKLLRIHTK